MVLNSKDGSPEGDHDLGDHCIDLQKSVTGTSQINIQPAEIAGFLLIRNFILYLCYNPVFDS